MAPPASPTPKPRSRRRGTIFAGLAVFLVVVTVAAVLVDRAVTTVSSHPWHDALGWFSVTVTDDWKVIDAAVDYAPTSESYRFLEVPQQQGWGATTFAYAFVSIEVRSYPNGPAAPAAPCVLHGTGYGFIPATVDGWTTSTDPGSDPNIYGTGWGFSFSPADASSSADFQVGANTPTPDTASQAQRLIDSLKTSRHGPC